MDNREMIYIKAFDAVRGHLPPKKSKDEICEALEQCASSGVSSSEDIGNLLGVTGRDLLAYLLAYPDLILTFKKIRSYTKSKIFERILECTQDPDTAKSLKACEMALGMLYKDSDNKEKLKESKRQFNATHKLAKKSYLLAKNRQDHTENLDKIDLICKRSTEELERIRQHMQSQ